jgi:hypothetical protein
MKIDVVGRVKNSALSLSKPLLPLFEAILNSIEAIEDAGTSPGKIDVCVSREENLPSDGDRTPGLISGFTIIDNGVGFDERNFDSFQTSDTRYKASRGAKGVGRFHWLAAFERVRVESVFRESGRFFRRSFSFVLSPDGILDPQLSPWGGTERRTEVSLVGYKDPYRKECPQDLDVVARRIIEHCLTFFMGDPCPRVCLQDSERTIDVNETFRKTVAEAAQVDEFTVKDKGFRLRYYKLTDPVHSEHRIHYCANQREVTQDGLRKYIPDLPVRFSDNGRGERFVLSAYVSGDYLDSKVSADRSRFDFVDDATMFPCEITMDELRNEVVARVKRYVQPYVAPMRAAKLERIRRYVEEKRSRYRATVKYGGALLDEIPADASDEKLDSGLAKVEFELARGLQSQREAILKVGAGEIADLPSYREKLMEFVEKYDDFGKSQLAEYVAHRKVILEIFEKALQRTAEGAYSREDYIHDLICPRRTTSDDIPAESMNLWIIDEKLSYHSYLASDRPIGSMGQGLRGAERPDIAIFNTPIALVEDDYPYSSVVIIEFKRPARDDYTDETDPIDQVFRYIERFREGKALDKAGRPMPQGANRRFFCYIMCDRTPKLDEHAKRADFEQTPDGLGFFKYHVAYSAYIEIIPFDKLLQDAQKRNRILFEKLRLE